MSGILFVTSFNRRLYEASGARLVQSFLEGQAVKEESSRMLICAEDGLHVQMRPVIDTYDLSRDRFLRRWLKENRSIIPYYLGGETRECDCRKRKHKHGTHRQGCPWTWMNRNASCWFRKVASLRYALSLEVSPIVWIDADCYFSLHIGAHRLETLFGGADVFYVRGSRKAIDSGIVGFRGSGGRDIIRRLCGRYKSGKFRQDDRWDDGYQLTRVIEQSPDIRTTDLVLSAPRIPDENEQATMTVDDVVPLAEIGKYIVHDKGRHTTMFKVVK